MFVANTCTKVKNGFVLIAVSNLL